MVAGLRLDVLLVLDTHMQLTKSIDCHWFHSQTLGGILLSTNLVIVIMSWWCYDNSQSSSSLRTPSCKRLHLFISKKSCFKDCSQAAIYSPVGIILSRMLHSVRVRTSHTEGQGVNMLPKKENGWVLDSSRRNLLEWWVGVRMVVQKLAF